MWNYFTLILFLGSEAHSSQSESRIYTFRSSFRPGTVLVLISGYSKAWKCIKIYEKSFSTPSWHFHLKAMFVGFFSLWQGKLNWLTAQWILFDMKQFSIKSFHTYTHTHRLTWSSYHLQSQCYYTNQQNSAQRRGKKFYDSSKPQQSTAASTSHTSWDFCVFRERTTLNHSL